MAGGLGSIFFIAYVTLLNAPETQNDRQIYERELLYWIVPIAGLLAGVFTYVAVLTSMFQIRDLNLLFQQHFENTSDDDSATGLPLIQGRPIIRHLAKITPLCLPLVFIITWLFILIW